MTARDEFTTPHAVEAEQSLLGGLLLDNDAVDRIGDLRAEHFYRADHAMIFSEIIALVTAGKPADYVTVYERIEAKGRGEYTGGLGYLTDLTLKTPSSANAARYAEIIRDRAVKRQLLVVAADVPGLVAGPEPARIIVDRVQSTIERLAEERVKTEPVRAGDGLVGYFNHLQDQMDGKIRAVPTGFRDLDEKLGGGFRGGELIIVAGRPAMGKTAFALNIANRAAADHSVLFLSMEMPIAQIQQRNVSLHGEIHMSRLRTPDLMTDEDWNRLTAATGKIDALNLYLDDQAALTLLEVRAKARMVKRKHGLGLIVLDYLGLMTGGPTENRNQEVGSYSRGLKALAKELDVPVLALAQLNRGLENRAEKRPSMADLRDSGEIEQDADAIMFLYRDEVYNPNTQAKGICEILIEKQRQGETGMVPLSYKGEFTKFGDLARGYQVPEIQMAPRRIRHDL